MRNFRLALCQFAAGGDKGANLGRAERLVRQALQRRAQVVVLPECFNSPYSTRQFPVYAEEIPPCGYADRDPLPASPSVSLLLRLARELDVDLVGGSIPEREGERVYNTCVCVAKGGKIAAKHRKVHLFDIDIPGKIRFQESETLTAGAALTKFKTEFTTIGLGICYDMRFPEYALSLAADEGVGMLIYPGNFNMTTGPKHWELLLRSRAVDNQLFCAGCSQARDDNAQYVSYGHSLVVNPWGAVMQSLTAREDVLVQDIDFTLMEDIRAGIPVRRQKRPEVYSQRQ